MITETERHLVKEIERTVLGAQTIQFNGEELPEEFLAQATGTPLATVDALFAIREGEPWRGMTDPKEIARAILRQIGVGE